MLKTSKTRNYIVLMGTLTSAIALNVGQAHAQQEGEAGANDVDDVIVVTGSLVRTSNDLNARAPVQVLGAAEIERSGAAQGQDIFKSLTVNTGSELSGETTNRAGVSSFSLRGLGVSSTLTLVNGRRAGIAPVSEPSGSDFTDINQFPLSMIERVEVLTDGASATYGSDAVAGVVNIITRKNFEGLEFSSEYRNFSTESLGVNIAVGTNFDKGHFAVFTSYYTQGKNDRTDFDWLDERILGGGDRSQSRLLSTTGAPGSYLRATTNADGLPELLPGALRVTDPDCTAAGGILIDSRCRFDFSEQFGPIAAEDRLQFFAEFDYNISDNISFYSEISASRNVINARRGAPFFNNGAVVPTGRTFIPGDHPFNFFIEDPVDPLNIVYIGPDAWDPAIHTGVDLVCECRPLGAEINGTNARADDRRQFDYIRFVGGFEFELPNDWYANTSFQYAPSSFNRTIGDSVRADVYNQLVADGEFNPFGTRLANPGLVSPKDGVSVAENEEDTIVQFFGEAKSSIRTEQIVADALITGSVFELPAGPLGIAIGGQYRALERKFEPDPLEAASEASVAGRQFPSEGNQDIWALFGEAVVPVTEWADVQLAIRREDFGGTIGSTTDPKIAARVSPTDWLTLRGSWGTSFQAPSLQQTSETLVISTVIDSAVPGSSGAVCAGAGLGQPIALLVSTSGADDLKPQSAKNYNIGAVVKPKRGLSFGVDYWNYDYTDLIAPSESAQAIVDNDCADDGVLNDPRVLRDGSGQLSRINTEFTNIGSVIANGLDFNANYFLPTSIGDFNFDGTATYVLGFDVDDPVAGTFDGAGNRNFTNNFGPQPQFRGNVGASWDTGIHSASVVVRYIGGYDNDQSNNAPIDSFTTVDLQYGIDLDDVLPGEGSRLVVGADNIFDVDPPALNRFDSSGAVINGVSAIDRPGYDPRVHDIRGRILYVRVKQTF